MASFADFIVVALMSCESRDTTTKELDEQPARLCVSRVRRVPRNTVLLHTPVQDTWHFIASSTPFQASSASYSHASDACDPTCS